MTFVVRGAGAIWGVQDPRVLQVHLRRAGWAAWTPLPIADTFKVLQAPVEMLSRMMNLFTNIHHLLTSSFTFRLKNL